MICRYCGVQFETTGEWVEHMARHVIDREIEIRQVSPTPEMRIVSCEDCSAELGVFRRTALVHHSDGSHTAVPLDYDRKPHEWRDDIDTDVSVCAVCGAVEDDEFLELTPTSCFRKPHDSQEER